MFAGAGILCCQHAGRVMIDRGEGGRIINLSSVDSFKVADDGARAIYSAAKAGVNHYTRMLAQQMRKHNITVNAIAPGPSLPVPLPPFCPPALPPPRPSLFLSLARARFLCSLTYHTTRDDRRD